MSESKRTDPSITGLDPSITTGATSAEAQDNSQNYLISPEMKERMEDTAQSFLAINAMRSALRYLMGESVTAKPIKLATTEGTTLLVEMFTADAGDGWDTFSIREVIMEEVGEGEDKEEKVREVLSGSTVNITNDGRDITTVSSVSRLTMSDDGVQTLVVDDLDGPVMRITEKPGEHLRVGDVWVSDEPMELMERGASQIDAESQTFDAGKDALQGRMELMEDVSNSILTVVRLIMDDKLDALQQKPKREAGDVAA
jgi:hypothetical protein